MKTFIVHIIATCGEYEKIVSNLATGNNATIAIVNAIQMEAHNELYLIRAGVYAEDDDSFTYTVRTVHEIEPEHVAILNKYGIY